MIEIILALVTGMGIGTTATYIAVQPRLAKLHKLTDRDEKGRFKK